MENKKLFKNYSQPHPKFMQLLTGTLEAIIEKDGWRFSLRDELCMSAEVVSDDALLPALIYRGQEMLSQALGGHLSHLGTEVPTMHYQISSEALCNAIPVLPSEGTAPLSVWLMVVHAALEDWFFHPENKKYLQEKKPIPLDPLYENFRYALENDLVVKHRPQWMPIQPAPSFNPETPSNSNRPKDRD